MASLLSKEKAFDVGESQPIRFLMNNFLASVDIKAMFEHTSTHLQCWLGTFYAQGVFI